MDVGWTVAPIGIANSNEPVLAVAHELFHDLNYYHASGACSADLFILWPPDEKGFIHGVGLDRRMNLVDSTGKWTGHYKVFVPGSNGMPVVPGTSADYFDLMSYCAHDNTVWISVDNWNVFGGTFPNGLFPYLDAFGGTIGSASAPLANRESKPVAKGESPLVTALLDPQGQVQFLSIASVAHKKPSASIRLKSDYVFVAPRRPRSIPAITTKAWNPASSFLRASPLKRWILSKWNTKERPLPSACEANRRPWSNFCPRKKECRFLAPKALRLSGRRPTTTEIRSKSGLNSQKEKTNRSALCSLGRIVVP
jgi:hypothetical protein